MSVLLIEQKLTIAMNISHRCLVMGHGSIVFEGKPEALQAHGSHSQGVAGGLAPLVPAATKHPGPARHAGLQSKKNDRSIFISRKDPMTAEYQLQGDVAVITLSNPPVNGLGYCHPPGHHRRHGVGPMADAAGQGRSCITGAGKAFSGGADIKEFGYPKALPEPNLLQRDLGAGALGQTGGGRNSQRLHGRRAGAGAWAATTASPHPARSVALPEVKIGPDARCRWHAAPAACAGGGSRAEHDRQR